MKKPALIYNASPWQAHRDRNAVVAEGARFGMKVVTRKPRVNTLSNRRKR